jgi:hypothetical protein
MREGSRFGVQRLLRRRRLGLRCPDVGILLRGSHQPVLRLRGLLQLCLQVCPRVLLCQLGRSVRWFRQQGVQCLRRCQVHASNGRRAASPAGPARRSAEAEDPLAAPPTAARPRVGCWRRDASQPGAPQFLEEAQVRSTGGPRSGPARSCACSGWSAAAGAGAQHPRSADLRRRRASACAQARR